MNLYEILGVKRSASEAEVRSAWLKKAKQTHPDAGGDAAAFKDAARAYRVLGDADKRIAYDQTGQEDAAPSAEEAAVTILRNLVEMLIADARDPAFTDFSGHMKSQLRGAMDNGKEQMAALNAQAERCSKMAKRFTAKSGDNMIRKILEVRIAEMQRQIAGAQQNIANIEAAQKLLESYTYRTEPRQQFVGDPLRAFSYGQQAPFSVFGS